MLIGRTYSFIQKLVKFFGYNIIIFKKKANDLADLGAQVSLDQNNIINLKVVLNRENLLKSLPKNCIIAELGLIKDFSTKNVLFL